MIEIVLWFIASALFYSISEMENPIMNTIFVSISGVFFGYASLQVLKKIVSNF